MDNEVIKTTVARRNFETWVDNRWRPAVAWGYLAICLSDFILFPILFTFLQYQTNQPLVQWVPITLQGAGLIHMAFGAIIGITAWGRTQEKIESQNK